MNKIVNGVANDYEFDMPMYYEPKSKTSKFQKLEKAMEGKTSYKELIIENQDKEIERLNNIIESIKEEIEIYIDVTIDHLETCNEEINFKLRNKSRAMREIKDELLKIIDKELKEGNKE